MESGRLSGRQVKIIALGVVLGALTAFLAWRLVRPMNIFVVSKAFERPVSTAGIPAPFSTLSAKECASCHREFYEEWSTTIHSQAWTDPYFQKDWAFDGKILGPYGDVSAPHPVERLADPNEICFRCHVVGGNRWDTFFRFPPCGTVAEIRGTPGAATDAALDCVTCHMPLVKRPVVEGGKLRAVRRHLWRGGHDPAMVKQGLQAVLREGPGAPGKRGFTLELTNTGAAHYLPTGTPDRHLSASIRILDRNGTVLRQDDHILKRTILWRPFIVELWDTRLPRWQPRVFAFEVDPAREPAAAVVEAQVRYHLLDEARRRRIGYRNKEPISYEVFRTRIALDRAARN